MEALAIVAQRKIPVGLEVWSSSRAGALVVYDNGERPGNEQNDIVRIGELCGYTRGPVFEENGVLWFNIQWTIDRKWPAKDTVLNLWVREKDVQVRGWDGSFGEVVPVVQPKTAEQLEKEQKAQQEQAQALALQQLIAGGNNNPSAGGSVPTWALAAGGGLLLLLIILFLFR